MPRLTATPKGTVEQTAQQHWQSQWHPKKRSCDRATPPRQHCYAGWQVSPDRADRTMDRKEKLFYAFRNVPRPRTAEGGYYFTAAQIMELVARRDLGLDASLAYGYLSEVMQTAGSLEDFACLLPAMLDLWSTNYTSMPDWNDALVAALSRSRILDGYVTPGQQNAVLEFIRDVILEHIDGMPRELSRPPDDWRVAFELVHGYGVYASLDPLWRAWWQGQTAGRVWAKVAYVSCLALDDADNPVLRLADVSESAPVLLNLAKTVPPLRWSQANVAFLEQELLVENVHRHLQEVGSGGDEARKVAEMIRTALINERWRFDIRAEDLAYYLASVRRSMAPAWRV